MDNSKNENINNQNEDNSSTQSSIESIIGENMAELVNIYDAEDTLSTDSTNTNSTNESIPPLANIENKESEDEEEDEEDEEENYENDEVILQNSLNAINHFMSLGFIPLTNINNDHGDINAMPNNFVFLTPINTGNLNLPNIAELININNNSSQEEIEDVVNNLIKTGEDNLHIVSQQVLDFIELCYLKNSQYDDDIINLIRYTIKNCFAHNRDFQIKEIISGIIYYSFNGNNLIFSENYTEVVYPTLYTEIKRIVRQYITLRTLQTTFMPPTMEDVKLVVDADIINKIPTSKYNDLDEKIKFKNTRCTVCQEDYNSEDTVRVLPCEHIFHPDCIDGWLQEYSYKCPCCRESVAEHKAKI